MIESYNKKEIETKIDQYVNGQLSPEEIDELWAELVRDGYHLDYLKTVANLKSVIRERREQKQAQKKRYWYYAAAAVVVMLIAVMSVVTITNISSDSQLQPIQTIELDYYRSGEGAISSGDQSEVIQKAINLANTGEINEAITFLEQELAVASEPEWISTLSLNIGSLLYNQGKYEESISHFENVIEHKNAINVLMLEKAYWYVGNAHFQLDHLTEARTNIKKAYELDGAYRRVTQSYLKALPQ